MKVQLNCLVCGATFSRHPCELKAAKYCSGKCRKIGVGQRQVRPIEERFWEKVAKAGDDECWLWTGAVSKGYGSIGLGRTWLRAHRLSYEMHHGEIPADQVVRHKCDTRRCVNPNHLEIGTQGDNLRDSYARSDREGFAKTVPDDVVLAIYSAPGRHIDVAARFGVSRAYVGVVKLGLRRAKITQP